MIVLRLRETLEVNEHIISSSNSITVLVLWSPTGTAHPKEEKGKRRTASFPFDHQDVILLMLYCGSRQTHEELVSLFEFCSSRHHHHHQEHQHHTG